MKREILFRGKDSFGYWQEGSLITDNKTFWFIDNHIPLHGVNVNPTQHTWTKSPKAYGQLYIDDAALGCPLIYNSEISDRPFVDWAKVEEMLKDIGVLS